VDDEMRDQVKFNLLTDGSEAGGAVATPSKAYVKYILEDENIPHDIHPAMRRVVYDKELALSNLKENEIPWLRRQLHLSEITFKMSRPALTGSYDEEIIFSTLPVKFLVKLSRSRDGGFERRQQTTQTVIKRVEGLGGASQAGKPSRWRRLIPGGGKGGNE